MMTKNKIWAIDMIVIVGTLVVLLGTVGYVRPLVIAPLDGEITTETGVLFEFEKADRILIDDNMEFSSPTEIYVEDNLVINLKPGVYYWKVDGLLESEVRRLEIVSEVDLKLKMIDGGESYEVVNSGNVVLDVDVYENGTFREKVVLDVDEGREVSGTKFVGSMGDEDEN